MVKAVKKPVTVKFRKGFNDQCLNAVEFAKMAESSGAAWVAVHGRTREQYYSGTADWEVIRQVKEAVKIPVIGNGDIFHTQDAARMMQETGCDGVMVARGAKEIHGSSGRSGSIWKQGRFLRRPSTEEIREMILRHGRMLSEYRGEMWLCGKCAAIWPGTPKGMKHSSLPRCEISQVGDS